MVLAVVVVGVLLGSAAKVGRLVGAVWCAVEGPEVTLGVTEPLGAAVVPEDGLRTAGAVPVGLIAAAAGATAGDGRGGPARSGTITTARV